MDREYARDIIWFFEFMERRRRKKKRKRTYEDLDERPT
jgi:hypothetical protein